VGSIDWLNMIIGGAITLVVLLIFYIPAARSLQQEASDLRRHFAMLMQALQNEGVAEFKWENGKPVSVVVRLSGSMDSVGGMSGDLTVGGSEPTDHHSEAPPEQK
jgi:hypothetical protein